MIEINTPEINVDEILARIRKEVQQRKNETCTHFTGRKKSPFSPGPAFSKHVTRPAAHLLPHKECYALSEFLRYHDSDFIDTAYASILRRSPDPVGKKHFLAKLQNGELTKTDIVGRLRYSREGRKKKVPVKGLSLPFLFQSSFKIPVVGWGLRIVAGVFNLPAILKNIQVIESSVFTQTRFAGEQAEQTLTLLLELRNHSAELSRELSELKADKMELAELSRQIKDHKLTIIDMQRRVQLLLEEARKRLPEPISTEQIETMVKEEDHLFDAMYAGFEDRFRGTREDIKERVKVYLPYVQEVLKTTDNASVLDVGCGRGEWLELLKEKDIVAKGLDLNRVMVAQCRESGLDVIESDAIDYLRNLKNNTLSVISGFHIVEHLPFKTLIALFDESLRVLKPGGLVMFETPNPENLFVGACNFYTDPSHKNPIPPPTLEFLLESRGFVRNKIHRLHPMKEVSYLEDKTLQDLNDLLYAATKEQDYALIGYKA